MLEKKNLFVDIVISFLSRDCDSSKIQLNYSI